MDDRNPAEVLPEVYRSVLDAASRLERIGERASAYELRRRALKIYSGRWNERGLVAMRRVVRDAELACAASPHAAALGPLTAPA
jgi:hypothetical protein